MVPKFVIAKPKKFKVNFKIDKTKIILLEEVSDLSDLGDRLKGKMSDGILDID